MNIHKTPIVSVSLKPVCSYMYSTYTCMSPSLQLPAGDDRAPGREREEREDLDPLSSQLEHIQTSQQVKKDLAL